MPNVTQHASGTIRGLLRDLPVFATELPEFQPDDAPDEPVTLFVDWLTSAVAAGIAEPHAAVLSTVDRDGHPSGRTLICKDVAPDGSWCFASSARSRKGREIDENPHAALTFYWPAQGRQIRVRGEAHSAGDQASARDFLARPAGSRAEALADRQSDVLDDPTDIDTALTRAHERLERDPDLVAPRWTLYALTATDVEFWQADRERRHVRLRYDRCGTGWSRTRLWP